MPGSGAGWTPRQPGIIRNPEKVGRIGAAWNNARRAAVIRQNFRCGSCGGVLDTTIGRNLPDTVETDHHPVDLYVFKRQFLSGQITIEEFNRRACDVDNLVSRHRRCHEQKQYPDDGHTPTRTAPVDVCTATGCHGDHTAHKMSYAPGQAVRSDGCMVSQEWLTIMAGCKTCPISAAEYRRIHGLVAA